MSTSRRTVVDERVLHDHGLTVRMRVVGSGENPLLLLNGLTRPLESWETVAEALVGRTLISLDAPGVGDSPTPILPLSIPALATIAASVLDEAGVGRADVLGFSHGGAVAQQLAAQSPSRVRGLVLASTSCGVGATAAIRRALTATGRGPGARSWPRPDALGAVWHSFAIATWSSIPFLGAIAAPTLVVCGTGDRVVPPANSMLLARRIPHSELDMLPGGHDLQQGEPARALAHRVDLFLTSDRVLASLPALPALHERARSKQLLG
jgi:poly(3-hydroxyoctanoate) depolymerase